jgi:hypothetical protein
MKKQRDEWTDRRCEGETSCSKVPFRKFGISLVDEEGGGYYFRLDIEPNQDANNANRAHQQYNFFISAIAEAVSRLENA